MVERREASASRSVAPNKGECRSRGVVCVSDALSAVGVRRLAAILGSIKGAMKSCGPESRGVPRPPEAEEEEAEEAGAGGRGCALHPSRKRPCARGAKEAALRPHRVSSWSRVASSQATQIE